MRKITISIPDMQSLHCQIRVNDAVKKIEGVQVDAVEPGKLMVSLNQENRKDEIIEAIENAGYAVSGEA